MKALILSHNTGGGHNSVSSALKEEFDKNGIECNVAYANIPMSGVTYTKTSKKFSIYDEMIKAAPHLYKAIYILGNMYSKLNVKSPLYGYNMIYAKNLEKYIIDNNIDLVIATHLFPGETITFLNKRNRDIHFVVVNTDYIFIPLMNEICPNYYIIPAKDLKNEFTKYKIEKKKLLPFGIPVSSKFKKRIPKEDARKKLGLPLDKKIILLMTGSMGFGRINLVIDDIIEKYRNSTHIVVLCGSNSRLKARLEKRYKFNLEALSYKNNVEEYMDACDVLLTKPGGISITEAAVKNVPMIMNRPIPGWEEINAEYFEKHNMAYYPKRRKDLIKYLDIIFNDKAKVNKMKIAQSKYINKNATEDLFKFLMKQYNKNSK